MRARTAAGAGLPLAGERSTLWHDQCVNDELLSAVERGDVERARELLLSGASAREDEWDLSLLNEAIARRDEPMANLLVEHGALLAETDERGHTRLHTAASASDDADTVRLLLLLGLDANAADRDGWTPLHHAAANGYTEVARVLVDAGADRDASTNAGQRPADLARTNGHTRLPL